MRFFYLLPLAIMGAIFYLSHQSVLPVRLSLFPGLDKICHFVAYGTLAGGLWLAFRLNGHRFLFLPSLLISLLYGISDEIHQLYVPGRSFALADILADFLGALVTLTAIHFFTKTLIPASVSATSDAAVIGINSPS